MSDLSDRTAWFHRIAKTSQDALVQLATQENIELFRLHVAINTPDFPLPVHLSAEQFAEAVHDFRGNEIDWNRATMAAMIKADDLFKAGNASEAASGLESFAATCPWALFKEAAMNQAALFWDDRTDA